MSGASDIAKLFEVAGGSPAQYREVERTEQIEGARGRWSAHADTDTEPDRAAQDDAGLDASQPLIAWSIAAVASEPPPVVLAVQMPPAIEAAVQPEAHAQPQAEVSPPAAIQPDAEPTVQPTPEPATPTPQSATLGSVFARLMERNEPRADVAPRGKS